jgi:hypothetical protein
VVINDDGHRDWSETWSGTGTPYETSLFEEVLPTPYTHTNLSPISSAFLVLPVSSLHSTFLWVCDFGVSLLQNFVLFFFFLLHVLRRRTETV